MKNNDLIIILPFCDGDGKQAVRLLDYIGLMRNKKPEGEILLVASPDSHNELRSHVEIAAKIAFEEVTTLPIFWPQIKHESKAQAVNNMFFKAAQACAQRYRKPWLWLEPDCVPLHQEWNYSLATTYNSQSRRYFGPILHPSHDINRKTLSRVAIYPPDAINELGRFSEQMEPFEMVSGELIVPCATKSRLIQQMAFTDIADMAKVRPDAVLLHHDKQGILLNQLWEKAGGTAKVVAPEALFAEEVVL